MTRSLFDAQAFLDALRLGGPVAEQATVQMVRHYRPLLRAQLFHAGVQADDIEDLLNEILFKLVMHAGEVRAPEAFHSWARTVARNETSAHWRRQARQPASPPAAADDEERGLDWLAQLPDPASSDPLLSRCLHGQLGRFKDEQPRRYHCIELITLGHDAREIAELIGRSYGATRQFMSECCAALLGYFKPCLDDGIEPMRRGAAKLKRSEP